MDAMLESARKQSESSEDVRRMMAAKSESFRKQFENIRESLESLNPNVLSKVPDIEYDFSGIREMVERRDAALLSVLDRLDVIIENQSASLDAVLGRFDALLEYQKGLTLLLSKIIGGSDS